MALDSPLRGVETKYTNQLIVLECVGISGVPNVSNGDIDGMSNLADPQDLRHLESSKSLESTVLYDCGRIGNES